MKLTVTVLSSLLFAAVAEKYGDNEARSEDQPSTDVQKVAHALSACSLKLGGCAPPDIPSQIRKRDTSSVTKDQKTKKQQSPGQTGKLKPTTRKPVRPVMRPTLETTTKKPRVSIGTKIVNMFGKSISGIFSSDKGGKTKEISPTASSGVPLSTLWQARLFLGIICIFVFY